MDHVTRHTRPNAVASDIADNARMVMNKESGGMWQETITMYFNIKLHCLLAFNNVLRIEDGT